MYPQPPPQAELAEVFPCAQHKMGESLSTSLEVAQRFDDTPSVFQSGELTREVHYQRMVWGLPLTVSVDQGEGPGASGVAMWVRRGRDQRGMAAQAYDVLLTQVRGLFGPPTQCADARLRPMCWWRLPQSVMMLSLQQGEQVPNWYMDETPPTGMLPGSHIEPLSAVLDCRWLAPKAGN